MLEKISSNTYNEEKYIHFVTGHLGMVKTKQLIRDRVWFPHIDKIVEEIIKNCEVCVLTGAQARQAPLEMTEVTDKP